MFVFGGEFGGREKAGKRVIDLSRWGNKRTRSLNFGLGLCRKEKA